MSLSDLNALGGAPFSPGDLWFAKFGVNLFISYHEMG